MTCLKHFTNTSIPSFNLDGIIQVLQALCTISKVHLSHHIIDHSLTPYLQTIPICSINIEPVPVYHLNIPWHRSQMPSYFGDFGVNFLIHMDTMANILYHPQNLLATTCYMEYLGFYCSSCACFPFLSHTGSWLPLHFLILISIRIGFEEPGVIVMLMFISCFFWHSLLSYCLDDSWRWRLITYFFSVFGWQFHIDVCIQGYHLVILFPFEIISRTNLDRTVHSV